ncbi:stress-related protein-like isoform X2 [Panicum virgatum]|uniref:Stress-related protein n=1 Tax=Panicum virgatum TaxID=38727 RepID=A0A8T0WD40_PANVG|nr:stress-related protein-like isoform X2 [Panicum virgatum]KAG2647461.1 hypothetical protein PVAP13_2KG592700 [Panicum virgatum]KAG2647464.1 hypothetical protein PVAP13_2KG592700 [Panicum virgatum]KAG2647465.1 hypothetical protein PVAP13_2KG592700 [Panicum virgatum]KAG2647467.1 hypothetical protein PVAP13_2KG592700 [Panicum virgatum]KAG2647468.1 hypothetical protein PVAP13_2KG592700 [Panicum virgatum]
MAEQPNPQPQVEEKEVVVEQQQEEPKRAPKLRYLDFVHVAAAQAAVCLAGLYGLAKGHAGPLRPGVDAVESAVKGLVGPVYDRFHSVPLDVLAFVDRKVDDTVHGLDKHLPGALKAASAQAYAVARGIPEVARELAAEAQQSGVKSAARAALAKVEPVAKDVYGRVEPVATDLYVRYEPAAEHLAVSTWRSLNGLPVFPQVAQIVVPTAVYWAEKYNKVIAAAANQGYTGAKYLPAIPTERIAKVFSSSTSESEPLAETQ